MCDCKSCLRDREFEAWRATLPEEARQKAEEIYEAMVSAESETEYYKAIIDGVWPSSVDILRRSLLKAKAIQAERAQ